MFFAPIDILVNGIFKGVVSAFYRFSLECDEVMSVGHLAMEEICLLIEYEGADKAFVFDHDILDVA